MNIVNEQKIIDGIKLLIQNYGFNLAQEVEKVLRNETRHFQSGEWLRTNGAGMESFNDKFPYGWQRLQFFWQNNVQYAPAGIDEAVENDSAEMKSRGVRKFLKFKAPYDGMAAIAEDLIAVGKITGQTPSGGMWFSIVNLDAQATYEKVLNQIIPRYCIKIKAETV